MASDDESSVKTAAAAVAESSLSASVTEIYDKRVQTAETDHVIG